MARIPDPGFTLVLLLRLEGLIDSDEEPCDMAVDLFWKFHNQSMDRTALNERLALFSRMYHEGTGGWTDQTVQDAMVRGFDDPDGLVNEVIAKLESLETAKRVSYEPDSSPRWEDLLISLHLIATRAWGLKSVEEDSEERRDTVEEAWRTSALLSASIDANANDPTSLIRADLDPIYRASILAVSGLMLLDRAMAQRGDGRLFDALSSFALGLSYLGELMSSKDIPYSALWDTTGSLLSTPRERKQFASPFSPTKPPMLQELDAQVMVDVFEGLRASRHKVDWRQVADDCDALGYYWDLVGRNPTEEVFDGQGKEWEWLMYWVHARTWAETRLEPSEMMDWIDRKEDRQAEERLRAYFFEEHLWDSLTERARRSLTDADATLLSGRAGRHEAALNDLRIAVEEVIYKVLCEPLSSWIDQVGIKDPKALDFSLVHQRLIETRKQPSLGEFEEMCRSKAMSEFLAPLNLSAGDKTFVTKTLPTQIRELRLARRDAEHVLRSSGQYDEVINLFRVCLGIRCEGILPRLLAIEEGLRGNRST